MKKSKFLLVLCLCLLLSGCKERDTKIIETSQTIQVPIITSANTTTTTVSSPEDTVVSVEAGQNAGATEVTVQSVETTTVNTEDNIVITAEVTEGESGMYKDTTLEATVEGVNNLTAELLKLGVDKDSICVSGFSAYSALMSVYDWTSGDTYAEINKVVGVSDSSAFRELRKGLDKTVSCASMFLVDKDVNLNTEDESLFTRRDMQSEYIVEEVNEFVNDSTNGLIPTLLQSPYSLDTKAAIIDAIYFKGDWLDEFDEANNTEETFYGRDSESTVTYMNMSERLSMYGDDIVELRYRNSKIAIDFIRNISDINSAYDSLMSSVNNEELLASKKVILKVPKFDVESDLNIKQAFENIGISKLFQPDADISKLANDMSVGSVEQKARIIVNEKGTEAAAVTHMHMVGTSIGNIEIPIEFYLDKPFAYIIRDTETGVVLFAGCFFNM